MLPSDEDLKWLVSSLLTDCNFFSLDHNCIHASDVLHGVFFMTTKKIPGFCPLNPKLSNDSDSDSDSGLNGEGRQKTSTSDYGVLMDSIPLLELLALYTAATMHDYDHPGRTNAFLVATLSPQVSLFSSLVARYSCVVLFRFDCAFWFFFSAITSANLKQKGDQ